MEPVEIRESITLHNQGKKIFAIFHRPIGKTQVPAIAVCPGFAGNKCGKFRAFVSLAKELAKNGIAVLRFDYRGAGDSEGEFAEMTIESKVSDALMCLDFLAAHPQVDPNRLGLFGRSLGGAIALLAARRYRKIKSLALWAPVFSSDPWHKLWQALQSEQQSEEAKQQLLHQLPWSIPNGVFLEQFFKLDMQEELQELQEIPLLHIQGAQDQIVKLEQAEGFQNSRGHSPNSRFVLLPKSGHDFSDPLELAAAMDETCQWFKRFL